MDDGGKAKKELLVEVQELRGRLAAAQQDCQISVEALKAEHRMAEAQWRQRLEALEAELAEQVSGASPPPCASLDEADLEEYGRERQHLLVTVQDQAEELQAANEELTIQTEELQAANEELTIQAEELRIVNEELAAQADILEHQKQELEHLSRELETERALLMSVLEQMPASVVIVKAPAGPILLSNRRAEEIWRQPLGSGTDMEIFWGIPRYFPDGRVCEKAEMPLWRSLATGEVVLDEEFSLLPPGGPPIHLSVSSAPVRDSQGRIVAGVVTHFDITARKRAETALRESREDLNRAQAVAHTGSWRLDVQHNALLWSEETCRMFGIPQGTPMTYEAFLAVVDPEDRAYVEQKWAAAMLGEPYDIEHRIVVNDAVKWVREKAELEFDSQDRLLGGFGTVQDITERKQSEAALRESEARFRGLFESMTEGVALHEVIYNDQDKAVDYRILVTNPAFAVHTGLQPEQIHGQLASQVLGTGEAPYLETYAKVAQTGQPVSFETFFPPLQRYFYISATSPQSGQFITVFEDITARKEMEQSLRQSNQRLDLLAETAGQLLASASPQQVAESICQKVMTFLDCDACFNFLADENEGRLRLNTFAGIPPEEAKKIEWLDYGTAVCGCAALEGCRIVTEQIQTTPDPRTELVKSYGIQAYACHPLLMQGRVLGTLSFGTRTRDRFSPDELALMKAVADLVAVAMDRKLAEEALRASEAREKARAAELQAVLDAVPVSIFMGHDAHGHLITGNLAASELLHMQLGENYSRAIHEDEHPPYRAMKGGQELRLEELPVQRAVTGQMVRDFEYDLVLADGTVRQVSANAVPLWDEAGRPRGAVAAYLDLTERKQAEDALKRAHDELEQRVKERTVELRDTVAQLIEEVQERQQAQESLRKQAELLELAHEAILVSDLDSRVTFWNQGASETYGWAREQALGRVAHVLLKTQFSPSWEEIKQNLLQTGQWQGELVHTRADGEKIVVASRMALQRDDQGQPVAILEINRDVTARRQAEAALKAERQRLLAVLERIPAHVSLLRQDHTFAYVNGEFIRRFGEPGTKRCYEIVGRKNPCVECQAMQVFHTEKPVVWEWAGSDGNTYQIYDYPFLDVDGSPLVLEMGVDITPRKLAEDQAFSLGRMYRMLSKVNEAMVRIGGDKDELFRQICRIMMEEGDFLLAWIGLVDPETRLVEAATQYNLNDDYLQNLMIPIDDVPEGRGPTGTAVREDRYDVCNDYATEPRMAPWREQALARGFRSSGAFPLRVGSQVVGVLTVYADRPGFFTADEIGLLESLSDDVSFALDFMDKDAKRRQVSKALRESEERLRYLASQLLHAQENERRRLALELHDDLGQSLMVLKLHLRAIEKTVPSDQWQTREECAHSLDYLSGIIHSVRRLARNLRPAVLEDLGISAGLRVLAEEFRAYHEAELSLEMDDIEGLFSREEEINIYRIFQEALTNIAKHAQARRVHLVIGRQPGSATFKVVDDGVGFDLEQVLARDPDKKGLGLAALEERVHMLGGELTITSQMEQGTEIFLTVPINQNRRAE